MCTDVYFCVLMCTIVYECVLSALKRTNLYCCVLMRIDVLMGTRSFDVLMYVRVPSCFLMCHNLT